MRDHNPQSNSCTCKGVPFPVLPLLFASSAWDDTDTDIENGWVKNPEVCDRDECKLLASISSSEPNPWWHSTRSTKSSFSLQVSVGMFLRIRYCRRSFTFNLINWGRWKAVSCSRWQVEHLLRFSCETEQTEQKSFLQSQHTCWGERENHSAGQVTKAHPALPFSGLCHLMEVFPLSVLTKTIFRM